MEADAGEPMSMSDAELGEVLSLFRTRIASLESDVRRCFWVIPQGPGPAFFPAVMYCFATLDYFSSHWAGWNRSEPGKDQTARLVEFLSKILLYGPTESTLAVHFWRHKLMHTAEPRSLRDTDSGRVYIWRIGIGLHHHMELSGVEDQRYRLNFDPMQFSEDLRAAILGPGGYFEELRKSPVLQERYRACYEEMDCYSVSLKPNRVASMGGEPAPQADDPSRPPAGG